MDKGLTKNEIITLLTRSEHSGKDASKLKAYFPTVKIAAEQEPEFMAHLIAWNEKNGSIRDSKIALPASTLAAWTEGELLENSFAHLALLSPMSLAKTLYFAKEIRPTPNNRRLVRLVTAYLREREKKRSWWDAAVLQHRNSIKTLYAFCHIKPSARANRILFDKVYKEGEIFEAVKRLSTLPPKDAAAVILNHEIPFQTAQGALGKNAKNPELVLALIERMTPNQLINNTKALERLGLKTDPALRAAFEAGLQRVAASKTSTNVFKTTRAVEAMGDVGANSIREKLKATQEKQIETMGRVKGRWAVLADRSGSMQVAIEAGREIAAALARMVEDEVHLIYFDTAPHKVIRATGKTYDDLLKETRNITANGGTSIGCGLLYLLEKGIEVDGIAIASDGAEHQAPTFARVYERYCKHFGKDVPVYLYDLPGEPNYHLVDSMKLAGFDMQVFDLRHGKIDYYALPNLIKTMSTKRYGLVDSIMETALLKVRDVIKGAEWTM